MSTSFFSEMLNSITERGRALLDRTRDHRGNAAARSDSLAELCEQLLTGRGEASGVALAEEILDKYAALTTGPRIAFFEALANRFGPDRARLDTAIAAWQAAPSDKTAAEIHAAAEARRQELLRRLNLAPGGTAALVRMRDQLIDALDHRDDLMAVDADFVHLFSSWFNRGFLVLRRIDWATPAVILEKIIRYEAVHRIRSWEDLRRRRSFQSRISWTASYLMIFSRIAAGVDQSIRRSTRKPRLNQDENRWTKSSSSALRSSRRSSASSNCSRMRTSATVPPGARLRRRNSSCRRGSEAA